MQQLESEIARIKDELQSTIESFQTTHQELTAANEEILAINEELQSTNEELETSKEEMQSVNEELITVNNQLTAKLEELSRTNDDMANFLNSSEVGTIFLDNDFCIRRFTPSMAKLVNVISMDIGRPISNISTNLVNVDLTSIAANVLKGLMPIESEVQARDGRWYMLRCLPYRTLSNSIDGTVITFTDVTSLKRSETALLEAKNYAENILNSTSVALLVLDPELKVVSANRAFYDTFKVTSEETDGCVIFEIGNRQWDSPELRKLLHDVSRENLPFYDFEVEHDFPRIGPRLMSLNAKSVRDSMTQDRRWLLLTIVDITERKRTEDALRHVRDELAETNESLEHRVEERTLQLAQANRELVQDIETRKRLEDQLRQSQKLESIGTMAAGIAHDFNNILNIISGFAAVLRPHGANNQDIAESVEVIDSQVKRGGALAQQLLTIGRKTEGKLVATDVNALLSQLVNVLRETFPKTIETDLQLSSKNPFVIIDSNQINQALLNLCVNARDAMPNGGRLTLKSDVVDAQRLPDTFATAAQRYVSLEIGDTGTGIDESVRGHLFEPFITTKELGQGSGLGLAVAYGIVQSHNGLIQVESKPMQGANIRIFLPMTSLD